MTKEKAGIFISHWTEENGFAVFLKEQLKQIFGEDLNIFVSSDYESISGGETWFQAVVSSLMSVRVVLVLVSQYSVDRRWINFEAGIGIGADATVIPIVIRHFSKSDVGYPLSTLQTRDIHNSNDVPALMKDIGKQIKIAPRPVDGKSFVEALENSVGVLPPPRKRLEPGVGHDFMQGVSKQIDKLNPLDLRKQYTVSEAEPLFIQALEKTTTFDVGFARLANEVAFDNGTNIAEELYQGFGLLLVGYKIPKGESGVSYSTGFDFHQFICHELFVMFFSLLIRAKRWALISQLLQQEILVPYKGTPESLPYTEISRSFGFLLLKRINLLKERHVRPDLAQVVPFDEFIDAEFFLFLRDSRPIWVPIACLIMSRTPLFLVKAQSKNYAQQLLDPLGIGSIEDFQRRVALRTAALHDQLRAFAGPAYEIGALANFDHRSIGSRP